MKMSRIHSAKCLYSIKMESFKHPAKLQAHMQLITESIQHCNAGSEISGSMRTFFPVSQSAVCAHFHAAWSCTRADALEQVSSPASSLIVLLLWLFGPQEPPRQREKIMALLRATIPLLARITNTYKSVHISSYTICLADKSTLGTSGR